MKQVHLLSAAFAGGLLILSNCSSDVSPTGPSSLSTSSEKTATTVANSAGSWALADEEFNCTNVREVHVRFSDPGFSEDNVVGLFVSFAGVPDTKMTLRVWWDYEGAPDKYEDVPFDDDDVVRDGDFVNVEKVIEHTYLDVNAPTTRKVRVELLLADQTGNCARVREVALNPPATSGGRAGFPPTVGTNGNAGVLSGNVWTVCRADSNTAWVASTGGGQYNAVVACQSLGYSGVNAWGGNCGTVCGYCGTPNETYDGNGGPTPPTDLGFTVHWRCN